MTFEAKITVAAATVTVIGTLVTIWQAWQVRSYRKQIKLDIRKINLSSAIDRLKRAQDDIRRIPKSSNTARGIKVSDLFQSIRSHFDFALGILDAQGPEADIRSLLREAQNNLNAYEVSWNVGSPNVADVHDLQNRVQDAVSQSNSRIYQLEGKA